MRRSTPICSGAERRSEPRSAGFTLVELLVASFVASAVLVLATLLVVSSRQLYELDDARTGLQQDLRNALDIIGADLRQAGQELPEFFPALIVEDGATPADPDVLVIRKKVFSIDLEVCQAATAGDSEIVVGTSTCGTVATNRTAWRDERIAQGGSLVAYVYDALAERGEFVRYTAEGTSGTDPTLRLASGLSNAYPAGSALRILEERRYSLVGEQLRVAVNGGTPQALTFDTIDFQVQVRADGATYPAYDSRVAGTPTWKQIEWVEPLLVGETDRRRGPLEREVSSRFLPRNTISR